MSTHIYSQLQIHTMLYVVYTLTLRVSRDLADEFALTYLPFQYVCVFPAFSDGDMCALSSKWRFLREFAKYWAQHVPQRSWAAVA